MVEKSQSDKIMDELNSHALKGREGNNAIYIEDVWDCEEDARIYRIEYLSTLDGRNAIAPRALITLVVICAGGPELRLRSNLIVPRERNRPPDTI